VTKLRRDALAVQAIVESESERLLRAAAELMARTKRGPHVTLWPLAVFDWGRMRASLEKAPAPSQAWKFGFTSSSEVLSGVTLRRVLGERLAAIMPATVTSNPRPFKITRDGTATYLDEAQSIDYDRCKEYLDSTSAMVELTGDDMRTVIR